MPPQFKISGSATHTPYIQVENNISIDILNYEKKKINVCCFHESINFLIHTRYIQVEINIPIDILNYVKIIDPFSMYCL